MQFKSIIGQEETKSLLLKSVHEGRISHAQLFAGAEGSGALSLAIAYAQYINCSERTETDSCGICDSCRKYEKLQHPDLHFTFPYAASDKDDTADTYLPKWRQMIAKNPYFGLDNWRDELEIEKKAVNINAAECHHILKKLSLKAFEAPYKVQIIWLPEYLGKESNRLLKIIEEPPAFTLFILVTENSERLLNTILSRTQMVKIPKYTTEIIAQYLINHQAVNTEKANEYAFLANGNLAAALQFTQSESHVTSEEFINWLRFCFKSSRILEAMDFGEEFAKRSRDQQKSFFNFGVHFLREIFLLASGAPEMVRLQSAERPMAEKLAQDILDTFMIQSMIQAFETAIYHIERNANAKILFLDVSLQLYLIFSKQKSPQKAVDFLI